jgi:hypothetical protein
VRGAEGGDRAGDAAPFNRRALLRAGALAAVVVPVLAACTSQPAPPPPDPLQRMLTAATQDATTAKAAATSFADNGPTLAVIATVRQQQAAALRKEVYRAAGGPPSATSSTAPATKPTLPAEATVTARLEQSLTTAQQQAAALMPALPTYRAGLVGSVAAGCASLAEALDSKPITSTSARSATPAASGGSPTLTSPSASTSAGTPATTPAAPALPKDTATALQHALAAENAALWLYGTASAYLTASVLTETIVAMQAVQNLRDATAAVLTSGGVTPQPAQPAYLVPSPITSQPAALAALGSAEAGASLAWRTVLEHTGQRSLRTAALNALIDSAVRQTRWRRLSGQSPASVAMPGTNV